MIIAVNTRLLLKDKLEGIGWFTFETFSRIVKEHPEHKFFFIFDRRNHSEYIFHKNVHPIVLSPPTRHPFLWYIWFEIKLPKILKQIKADIFISPDGFLSLKSKIPSLAVIHDINFEHYPKNLKFSHRLFYRHFFKKYAQKASHIATVSKFSKNDICKNYNILPSKIDVCHNGVSSIFHPIELNKQLKVKNKFSKGEDYFLFVGALHPRKNIIGLLKAFDSFKHKSKSQVKLIFVGNKMWWNKSIKNSFKKLQYNEDIMFLGRRNQLELNDLYGSAISLCFIPYYEGFGIPILEAMKCACPVITSNVSAIPEVVGNAALLVNPFQINEITDAMTKLYSNRKLRAELSSRGQIHSQYFNWNKTAKALWKSIEKVMHRC